MTLWRETRRLLNSFYLWHHKSMATDPNDIRLSDDERKRLAILADSRGITWSEVVSDLLDSAEAILGIERGLASAQVGEGIPADEVHDRIRDHFSVSK